MLLWGEQGFFHGHPTLQPTRLYLLLTFCCQIQQHTLTGSCGTKTDAWGIILCLMYVHMQLSLKILHQSLKWSVFCYWQQSAGESFTTGATLLCITELPVKPEPFWPCKSHSGQPLESSDSWLGVEASGLSRHDPCLPWGSSALPPPHCWPVDSHSRQGMCHQVADQ